MKQKKEFMKICLLFLQIKMRKLGEKNVERKTNF